MKIVPLTHDYTLTNFDCGDSDLNEFLMEDAKPIGISFYHSGRIPFSHPFLSKERFCRTYTKRRRRIYTPHVFRHDGDGISDRAGEPPASHQKIISSPQPSSYRPLGESHCAMPPFFRRDAPLSAPWEGRCLKSKNRRGAGL